MSSRNYLPLFHKGSIMFGTIGSRPSHVDGESVFFGVHVQAKSLLFLCVFRLVWNTTLEQIPLVHK